MDSREGVRRGCSKQNLSRKRGSKRNRVSPNSSHYSLERAVLTPSQSQGSSVARGLKYNVLPPA